MSLDLLVHIVIVLVILGIVWWVLQAYVLPSVAEPFRTLIIVAVALCVILFLLSLIGTIPRLRMGEREDAGMLKTIQVVIDRKDTGGLTHGEALAAIERRISAAGIPVAAGGLWDDYRPPVASGTLFLAHAPWDDAMVFRWIGVVDHPKV